MQSHSHGLSKNHPAPTSVPVTFSTSNNMVSQSLESRMKKLKIHPQSPSSVSDDISAGSVSGGVVASPGSKTYRSRARMDLPWKKEEPTASHSSVSKYGQAHQSGSNNGGCVTSSNFEMSVAKNSGDSRAGVDEAGRVGGVGDWNKGRRRAKPRRGIDVQSGTSNDPRGGSDDGWRGRKGKRVGSRGERTTTSMTEGVKDQKDIRAHHQYQRKHQYRPYQTQFQPQYRPVDTARVRGYHQVYQEQQQQQQQRYTPDTRTNIVKNSLLLDIQSRSPQSTQLTHLTLLRYEFLLDEFLEMIQLLPSLQVLDLEIISLLPSPQPRSQGQDQPALQLAQNNQEFAYMQRVEDHFNQDSDNGCMLVDQDDQAQWESRSRQQSQSNGFSDKDSNDRQRSFGNCICRVGSQQQFPKVRSLTFRGTIVVPELLKHFPNLEEFALEETRLPPMTATLHPVFASPGLHNTPSSAKNIGNKSLYASGYSSNFSTDSDSDGLNAAARDSLPAAACSPSFLSTMISDLAHSLLEGCPRLTRLVLKEPLLVEDGQARGRSQQLTLLVRAVPQLRQFVANKRVVTSCPLLIETLFDYHHAHLCSFQVIDDPSSEATYYTQPQQPYERQYLQQQRYQEQIRQHHHLNSRQYSELLQQTLQLQQQHREQELDALLRLRAACFRILEGCPLLQIFEVKVPLPLQDLIASVPRWVCGPMLTVLRLDIEELTVDGGLDTEEEEVMQIFASNRSYKCVTIADERFVSAPVELAFTTLSFQRPVDFWVDISTRRIKDRI
ncbi:hypothetical protein BGZ99_001469 [Dissophora globulifera]|uniref:Uncharacterized protein n=1 Tax=Dissophora globulifera TaxID=979702 RepID=A0A9P6UY14_9FUNG|nr:hypothetical protein BGZ99_001469 [Dissophora globulifera]